MTWLRNAVDLRSPPGSMDVRWNEVAGDVIELNFSGNLPHPLVESEVVLGLRFDVDLGLLRGAARVLVLGATGSRTSEFDVVYDR